MRHPVRSGRRDAGRLTIGLKRTDEFRQNAVRIALTNWITAHRDAKTLSQADLDRAKEHELLRRESRLLTEEREIQIKARQLFAGPKH